LTGAHDGAENSDWSLLASYVPLFVIESVPVTLPVEGVAAVGAMLPEQLTVPPVLIANAHDVD
jgi:hypothetical protein